MSHLRFRPVIRWRSVSGHCHASNLWVVTIEGGGNVFCDKV